MSTQAIRDALAEVIGLLGKPSLHSGHVIYAETEEWPCVDINVKLAANKLVSPKVARFIAATANPANLAALLKELDAKTEALNRLYVAAPITLECKHFHHSKREQHRSTDECGPAEEYQLALKQARAAITPSIGEQG